MATRKQTVEELRRRTMMLACKLTAKEMAERQDALVETTNMRADREAELERWKADKKEEQKLYEGEVVTAAAKATRLAKIIRDKEEFREVEVVDTISGSTVTTRRDDTGEVIAERAATDAELQKRLNLEAEAKK